MLISKVIGRYQLSVGVVISVCEGWFKKAQGCFDWAQPFMTIGPRFRGIPGQSNGRQLPGCCTAVTAVEQFDEEAIPISDERRSPAGMAYVRQNRIAV